MAVWWDNLNLENNIIDIELSSTPPPWQSSTPLPERQLSTLGSMGFVDNFRDYNRDDNLGNFLKGKTVALVGPSPHLLGMKKGEYIDSFDFVARVNQNSEMPQSQWEDYGKRTDILFNCLNINKLNALANRNNDQYFRDLKYIICSMVSMWDIERVHKFLKGVEKHFDTPWHNVCDGYLFKIFKEVGTTCNTGLTSLITLLNYDVKSVYMTGMTFFNMNRMGRVYFDEYHDDAVKHGNFKDTKNKQPEPAELRMDIHAQQPQIDYFRKIVSRHYEKKLTMDEFLQTNFLLGR